MRDGGARHAELLGDVLLGQPARFARLPQSPAQFGLIDGHAAPSLWFAVESRLPAELRLSSFAKPAMYISVHFLMISVGLA